MKEGVKCRVKREVNKGEGEESEGKVRRRYHGRKGRWREA